MLLHPKHFVDETSGPTGGDLLRLPGNMKRANDYPRGISVQAKTMVMDIQQRRGPRIVLPSHLRLRQRLRGYVPRPPALGKDRSEEHTSELQSLMRISYAVFCWNKNTT